MKFKLIKPVNPEYSALEQVLTNRGIPHQDIQSYLHTTDEVINSPYALGKDKIILAIRTLIACIKTNKKAVIIVDSDCDGFTSAAILMNYLYDIFPTWVENNLSYFIHEGKEHGLKDYVHTDPNVTVVIVPDGGSNDYEEHKALKEKGVTTIVLDHHEAEEVSKDAIVINNQLCNYDNKFLSGAGIVYQFCKVIDDLYENPRADRYLDLAMLGNVADMMSLKSFETKRIIEKGMQQIKNPFISAMMEKNAHSLGEHPTSFGIAFYVAPYVNAIVRSGTQEEKKLVFESMLYFKAFHKIPSTKRGHKPGEMETLVAQAIRTATNVKNRQTKAQDAGLEKLEQQIKEYNLLENKVLLLLVEPGQVDKNIAGLIANKLMAKYSKPCCILTREDILTPSLIYPATVYQGSARGCDKTGVTDFRQICLNTNCVNYATGHAGAFGLSISKPNIDNFLNSVNEQLKDVNDETIYDVDYIYDGINVNPQNIIDIANLNDLWGKDMPESKIAIQNLKVTENMVTLMSPDKKPTLKITLPNKVCLIKFNSNQEEYESILSKGYVELNIVGTCNINEWNGNITPQVFIEEYEIIDVVKYWF